MTAEAVVGGTRSENALGSSVDARERDRLVDLIANDETVRWRRPRADVRQLLRSEEKCLAENVAAIMEAYADRPALGQRAQRRTKDPGTGRTFRELLPEYTTTSYADLWSRVRAAATEFRAHQQRPVEAGDFVCLLGFTSGDYAMLELACIYLGAVSVPLQNSASVGQLEPIVAETEPTVLATSVEFLDHAVELAIGSASRPRVVVFDFDAAVDDEREKFERASRRMAESGISLEALADVLERGHRLPAAELVKGDADRLALLVYTSGSTGTPKGAMYPERLVHRLTGFLTRMDTPAITISYTPMSHLAGRSSVLSSLARGGTTYFTAKSDQSMLFEDIQLVRPTELALVPRVCDVLFERYQSERERRSGEFADEQVLEAVVKQDLRESFLGGRIVQAVVGSGAIASDMASFLESTLDLPLHNDYGSTEAGGITMDTHVLRPPVIDYKLDEVPELGYFSTDTPHPRGELLVKTENIFPGYYKRPEITAEVFDEEGYYRTGDIMAEVGPDQLVHVDRRNSVLKLSQGEFVAMSRLEAVFVTSPLVRQIFVYGNTARSYLLAVIVPTAQALERFGNLEALKAAINASLVQVANDAELHSYEIPRDHLVETTPFSTENGMLSDARKPLRPRLTQHYGHRLEQLYTELADRQATELRGLRQSGQDKPALETVSRAAQALLGCSGADLNPQTHFTDLGGDSLSALSFSNLLQEIFDVELPVEVVISPANDLRALSKHIERERAVRTERASFATVHGKDATQVRASELTLDKFLPESTLKAATSLPGPTGEPRTVLLTGPNGYLGRFLCLDWLERLSATGGKLICIVRAADADAARKRLDEAFDSGDAELLQRYRRLADEHLEVLAGDIGKPNLDLDEQTWQRLITEVDLVVHPAALVNHVLPYHELFRPNVAGTAEIIRMAISNRIKPVIYPSTVGVASQIASAAFDEDSDIRFVNPRRTLDDGYASGYATSKWAGEVLMREAHDHCGMPVAAFRLDLIMAHSRYTGQLNVADMFTRLLLSLIATGIAPKSFYTGADGSRPRAHYDALPADFTAEAITTLGMANTRGYRTYNVLNPHDDGISLDVVVDWLVEAGHNITRIHDFDAWARRFETAIRALPDRQRQQSLLPLLHAFREPQPAVAGSAIPVDRFRQAVQQTGIGTARDIPHLSKELIDKYIRDLQHLDLL